MHVEARSVIVHGVPEHEGPGARRKQQATARCERNEQRSLKDLQVRQMPTRIRLHEHVAEYPSAARLRRADRLESLSSTLKFFNR
jgi:hypothetical protein